MCVIVLFSIGFAASGEPKDETKSASSPVGESVEDVVQQSESEPKEIQLIGSKDVSEVEKRLQVQYGHIRKREVFIGRNLNSLMICVKCMKLCRKTGNGSFHIAHHTMLLRKDLKMATDMFLYIFDMKRTVKNYLILWE